MNNNLSMCLSFFIRVSPILAIFFVQASFSKPIPAKTLTACIDHYPPLQIVAPEPYGENITALTLLANLTNRELVLVVGPNFARCLRLLELGKVDILAGLIDSPKRRKIAHLISYQQDTPYIFVTRKKSKEIIQFDDLYNRIIGVTTNTLYFNQFDQNERLNKVIIKDINTGLKMLAKNRIDVVITAQKIYSSLILELSLESLLKVNEYKPPSNRRLYFAISKKNNAKFTLAELNQIKTAAEQLLFQQAIENFIKNNPQLY